ncbi:MAG: hypothetical protein WDO68_14980 [Gammaproteobacteria bacterium]
MRIWLAPAATLFVLNAVAGVAFAQGTTDPQRAPPPRELLQPPKKGLEASPITDRFALRVTYFAPSIDTFLRLDRTTGQPGTDLRVEDDLGLDDKANMARIEMIFRLREKNRLRVDYFKSTRYGDKVLDKTVAFGDQTFFVNDRARTSLDYRALGLTYTRSVLYFDRFELGLGVGISLLEAHAKGEVVARNVREKEDGVAPYPTIALDSTWRISKRWSFNGRAQTLTAHLSDFTGSLSDYHGDIQYRWRRNFAFGLGYTSLRIRAESTSTKNMPGKLNQDISGPEVFIRASF